MMYEIEREVFDGLNEIFRESGFSLVFSKHGFYEKKMVFLISEQRKRDDATMCCWESVHDMFIEIENNNTLFSEIRFLKKNLVQLDEISGFKNFSRFLAVCDHYSLESLAGCSCLEEVLLKLSCLR